MCTYVLSEVHVLSGSPVSDKRFIRSRILCVAVSGSVVTGAHDRGEIPLIPSQRMTLSHGRGVDFDALIIQVLSNLGCRVGLV